MFDFSGDEAFCLLIAAVIACIGCVGFYRPLFSISLLGRSGFRRTVLAFFPIGLLILTAMVLNRWADAEVSGHLDYEILFLLLNIAWLAVGSFVLRLLGIGFRGDVIDRDNEAAMIAWCGWLASVSIIYALANVGGGPTIWTTIVPAVFATLVLLAVALLMEFIGGGVFESITIDRDAATALRAAGTWVGCSLILGRAAGGTWISLQQSAVDLLRFGWPVLLLAMVAGLLHHTVRPSIASPRPGIMLNGVVPALVFVAVGIISVGFTPHNFYPSKW